MSTELNETLIKFLSNFIRNATIQHGDKLAEGNHYVIKSQCLFSRLPHEDMFPVNIYIGVFMDANFASSFFPRPFRPWYLQFTNKTLNVRNTPEIW